MSQIDEVFLKDKYLDLPYRIYIPKNPIKLFVFLHGAGERGDDNTLHIITNNTLLKKLVSNELTSNNFIVLAPHCYNTDKWCNYQLIDENYSLDYDKIPLSKPLREAKELIELIQERYHIDSNSTIIEGLSMGGLGTLALSRRFNLAKKYISICGAGDLYYTSNYKNKEFLLFHGTKDPVINYNCSLKFSEMLNKNKIKNELVLYEGFGHDSWTSAHDSDLIFDFITK
ncbi:MAG: dienelactone hydrolase family protein [Acholeplasmatales bacterium]|jgi:predicted peptidase|nr:dienelactone hydrolase family protein [Acholeplasmatales bacterium]